LKVVLQAAEALGSAVDGDR
jgi:transcriptional regulator with XRE-family HTH domain